jgi:hypothetical protein
MQNQNLGGTQKSGVRDVSIFGLLFSNALILAEYCNHFIFFDLQCESLGSTVFCVWLHLPPRVPRIIVAEVLEIKDHEHRSDSPSRAAEQAARSASWYQAADLHG